ncbi:DUF3560 domain-containing protein [Ohessyouella blattaphilus]|uniref:DUF3560 domain-containing protein n=1 Tax=Ohessyouella blattaphilus TaxID=2949333 RepID=A0ABT1EGP2_9FIRM|nr:DUF3560 domain-containing protein [Ohessyouella blattaphilus]MCP1109686.1 DUF3560 domain-containing protein [Ohessyouella blattaphilus]MCR8563080.1 DUF3560 domain-containing protein [Ohessyouella blattaphilus]
MAENNSTGPSPRHYIFNLESTKIELHFDKSEYAAMTDEQKRELKGAFLFSGKGKCWVSRAKEPNLWRAKQVAEKLGFTGEQREGERLSYAEQLERQAERAEARADRYEGYAANAAGRAEQLQKPLESMRGDISFFTQPNINSSAGRAFTNYRERLYNRYHKGFEEYRKSEYFIDRAVTARGTASQAQFSDPAYLDRRIKECQKEIRAREKNAVSYEKALTDIENGVERKKYSGEVITADEVKGLLSRELELIEKAMDKQGYLENCLDDLGGRRFSKENVKPGYIANIPRWGPVEILSTGPQNVGFKILTGGAKGGMLKAAYAEISEIIKAEEKKPPTHPFEVGEKFTAVHRDYSNGLHDVKTTEIVYEIVKATDTTIRLKPLDSDEKPITRKPVKTYSGQWRFSINDTYGNTFYKAEPPPQERPSALDKLAAAKDSVTKNAAEKPDKPEPKKSGPEL